MGLNLAVIGTSNSILVGGYSYGLRAGGHVNRFANLSLGFSASILLAKVLKDFDFYGYHYILLDFTVNETDFAARGLTSLPDIRSRIVDFIARATLASAIPVFVIMPTLYGIYDPSPVVKLYRDMAQVFGIPVFNAYDYIKTHLSPVAGAYDCYFRDANHLAAHHAHGFGVQIAAALARCNRGAVRKSFVPLEAHYHGYKTGAQLARRVSALVTRRTSLVVAELLRLNAGETLEFEFESPTRLVGVGANIAQSNANLVISNETGQQAAPVELQTIHFSGDGAALDYVMLPVPSFSGRKFTVRVEKSAGDGTVAELAGFVWAGENYLAPSPVWRGLIEQINPVSIS